MQTSTSNAIPYSIVPFIPLLNIPIHNPNPPSIPSRRQIIPNSITKRLIRRNPAPQARPRADDQVRDHAAEDDLAVGVEMGHVRPVVAPVVRPRGIAADGVDVGQARGVQVDEGRTARLRG